MRLTTILLLTMIYASTLGQRLAGNYNAYYGHSLELKGDSTFTYEWRFDLIRNWAIGKWSFSDKILHLHFTTIYDTLVRPDKPDSIVLSGDTKSSKIYNEFFLIGAEGQDHSRITERLVLRRKRLYQIDKNGKLLTEKQSGIWTKKKRPTYYFKVD